MHTRLQIGEDILEVGEYGFYMLNGIVDGDLDSTLMGGKYPITRTVLDAKNVRFDIEIMNGGTISVKAHKDLVSVTFSVADKSIFHDAGGILGNDEGTRYSRSGDVLLGDDNAFGEEWQVRPGVDPELFQTKSDVEWPTQRCAAPASSTLIRPRLR